MKGHFSRARLLSKARMRRFARKGRVAGFARGGEGATMIEFALIFPIVLMITFGIMEISLCMASLARRPANRGFRAAGWP